MQRPSGSKISGKTLGILSLGHFGGHPSSPSHLQHGRHHQRQQRQQQPQLRPRGSDADAASWPEAILGLKNGYAYFPTAARFVAEPSVAIYIKHCATRLPHSMPPTGSFYTSLSWSLSQLDEMDLVLYNSSLIQMALIEVNGSAISRKEKPMCKM